MTDITGQMPENLENITFDRETIEKLMKNKSFASAIAEVTPPAPDPRRLLLKSAGFSMFDNNTLISMARSLNSGKSAKEIENNIREGVVA